ncbi:MAG TPA: hypothetical protein VJM31_00215 [Vicinamibacterales bacterium]|nr:hypothetical protein [Vicinamibacterales bacterium]
MSFNYFVAVLLFAVISLPVPAAYAAEKEQARIVDLRAIVLTPPAKPALLLQTPRPSILPLLYATLGATQAWDVYSTRTALKAGAREANPATAAFSANTGALIGLKAATTAGTILFAERMWKKNKVAAIVMLAAVNGATAAVSMHNMRNAKAAR